MGEASAASRSTTDDGQEAQSSSPPVRNQAIRGLENPATACHVSGPLLLLAYALTPVADTLVAAAPLQPSSTLLQSLAQLLQALLQPAPTMNKIQNSNDDPREEGHAVPPAPVNPLNFYRQLERTTGIRAHSLGDATTSLLKLLAAIRDDSPAVLADAMNEALYSGKTISILTGERVDPRHVTLHRRSKTSPPKTMAVPFHVSLTPPPEEDNVDATTSSPPVSLCDILREKLSPILIQGYTWSRDFEETVVPLPDDTASSVTSSAKATTTTDPDGWSTWRQLQIKELPPFWLIHVDRFSNSLSSTGSSGRCPCLDNCRRQCTVPLTLHAEKDLKLVLDRECEHNYHLTGAILHVDRPVHDIDEEEDEERGHYVALVRARETSREDGDSATWVLIDDAQTKPVSQDMALQLMAGCESNLCEEDGSFLQATLVVYASCAAKKAMSGVTQSILEKVADMRKADEALIGRRLQVLWSGGKYYAGAVVSFDHTTGKHTVRYDDGDVRVYNLSKKTIKWLDQNLPNESSNKFSKNWTFSMEDDPAKVKPTLVPADVKELFDTNGYAIFPNVLPKSLVDELNHQLEEVLRGRYDRDGVPDKTPRLLKNEFCRPKATVPPETAPEDNEPTDEAPPRPTQPRAAKTSYAAGPLGFSGNTHNVKVLQIINIHKSSTAFRRLAVSPVLGRVVAELAGWTRIGTRLAQDQVWAKPPGAPALTFHRDSPYFMFDNPHVVTVWIALDDMDDDALGPLQYVKGSHKWGAGRVGSANQFFDSHRGMDLLQSAAKHADVPLDALEIESLVGLAAGGISIHDGQTWHGSGPNNTRNRPRRGLGLHFVPANVRFTAEAAKSRLWQRYLLDPAIDPGDVELQQEDFPITWMPSQGVDEGN